MTVSILKTLKYNLYIYKTLKPKIYIGRKTNLKILGELKIKKSLSVGVIFSNKQKTIFNLGKNATCEIYKATIGNGCRISIAKNAKVIIGNNVCINENTRIMINSGIVIGDDTIISFDVNILDSDQHRIFINNQEQENTKPIVIGKNVWVGSRVTILKGVLIGEGAVIASNSVVTKEVPPFTLVGGNPAKIIKYNVSWER